MRQRAVLLLAVRCPGGGKQADQQCEDTWRCGGRRAPSGTAPAATFACGASVNIGATVFCLGLGIGIGIGIGISVDIPVAITVGVGVSVSFDIGISVDVGIAISIAICISVGVGIAVAVGAVR